MAQRTTAAAEGATPSRTREPRRTAATARRRAAPGGTAAGEERAAQRPEVTLPVVGTVAVPSADRLVFYAALGVLAAFEIIEWPVALVVGAGHFLAAQHVSHALQEIGQAAEAV
ncbi:hypothetical protein GCM10022226_05580 [Sphaerisporangium flaviroseum]|uniref:Heavy metal translocating P-type ATPase n=1 Tax=Sphaerisporangium flaviroseum TaxID=509199 RepID=A0ABP7HG42_9ACTN